MVGSLKLLHMVKYIPQLQKFMSEGLKCLSNSAHKAGFFNNKMIINFIGSNNI